MSNLKYQKRRCLKKRKFLTREDVVADINYGRYNLPIYPYKCPICDGWHKTRQERKMKLTPEDKTSIVYFWQEKEDPTRWVFWKEKYPVIEEELPHITMAWRRYLVAKRTLDTLMMSLQREAEDEQAI